MLYGSGKYTYELVDGWAKCPKGFSFIDVAHLAIDSQDRVYVFSRSDLPVMVFDRDGNLLSSWGVQGFFGRVHGGCVGPDDSIYVADDHAHLVLKFTREGIVRQILGNRDKQSDTGMVGLPVTPITRSSGPFNRPTGVAVGPSGEIFVSDGYGNARIHKFSPEGKLLLSWGEPGAGTGQFKTPHEVWVDKQSHVWVSDRENNRVQIFDDSGKFLSQWTDFTRPTDVFIDDKDIVYVTEFGRRPPEVGTGIPRVSIFTIGGKLLARWGNEWKKNVATDLFVAPHAVVADSQGSIYVGEVAVAYAGYDRGTRTVQKFARRS